MKKHKKIITPNGPLTASLWEASTPKSVVLLLHGMMEHAGRYDGLAHSYVQNGYSVLIPDLRGHGPSIDPSQLGIVPRSALSVFSDDISSVFDALPPTLPVILIGHSFGSFLALYVTALLGKSMAHPRLQKLILSGSTYPPADVFFGKLLSHLFCRLGMRDRPAHLLQKLVFGSYNRSFPKTNSAFDWISADPECVKDYLADPLCGFTPSYGFFELLFSLTVKLRDKQLLSGLPKTLPIHLISGKDDPVSHYGKGVIQLARILKTLGILTVDLTLLDGQRHENLNSLIELSIT